MSMLCCLAWLIAVLVPARAQDGPSREPPEADGRFSELLHDFHRVMPRDPARLREAAERRRCAPAALPVLRNLIRYLERPDADRLEASSLAEFETYAIVLGDEQAERAALERASAGDASARLLLAAASAITAEGDRARFLALDAICAHFRSGCELVPRAARVLMLAGDLAESEARLLAAATKDEALTAQLVQVAEARARDPRKLLDKPLELAGKTLAGKHFSTAAWAGKVVLVDFWATWCAPCVKSLEHVAAARAKYGARGLEVVGISCDKDAATLRTFLAGRSGVSWPQLFDEQEPGWHELATRCGVSAIPRVFLIDRKGVVRSVDAGDKLDELLPRLLAE